MRFLALLLLLAADQPTAESKLASMTWLAGTWSGEMWGGEFTAHYSTPKGGRILSYSVLRKGGKRVFYEFEVFEVQKGKLVYSPFPGGKPAVPLVLTKAEGSAAVFENPKKDYPTRIAFTFLNYRKGDELRIVLDDPHNKSDKKEVFSLKRAP